MVQFRTLGLLPDMRLLFLQLRLIFHRHTRSCLNKNSQIKLHYLEKGCLSATASITKLTWCFLGSEFALRHKKQATGRLRLTWWIFKLWPGINDSWTLINDILKAESNDSVSVNVKTCCSNWFRGSVVHRQCCPQAVLSTGSVVHRQCCPQVVLTYYTLTSILQLWPSNPDRRVVRRILGQL
jgi:hypothetical protein